MDGIWRWSRHINPLTGYCWLGRHRWGPTYTVRGASFTPGTGLDRRWTFCAIAGKRRECMRCPQQDSPEPDRDVGPFYRCITSHWPPRECCERITP